MTTLSRRSLLTGASALGVASLMLPQGAAAAAAPEQAADGALLTVPRGDVRHATLSRGQNQRFVSDPDTVHLPTTTREVVQAVQSAVRSGRRLGVRSGGHCYEGFVDGPDTGVIVDVSQMTAVGFDPARRAVTIEAGTLLGPAYAEMFKRWGVTLPGGSCHTVGAGGHVTGGGYGQLSRAYGLIVDHLDAVEVVVVDSGGTARAVVATAAADDPNRELWWAHTGGGGGSFGVVTRFWFRTPGTAGSTPATVLPRPPATVWLHRTEWSWDQMTGDRFARLMDNYGRWNERNSAPDSPYTGLFARLELSTRASAPIHMVVQMDADRPDARRMLDAFLAEINAGVGVRTTVTDDRRLPWLQSTGWQGLWVSSPTDRFKYKSSYHRRRFTPDQIGAFYRSLTQTDHVHPGFAVSIATYGGRVNAVRPEATAEPHRDSVLKLLWGTAWPEARDDDRQVRWFQQFYRAVYARTGGVPVLDVDTDGCFINYPDIDLNDPAQNTSGVSWSDLYFKQAYPRLQRVKARYDPRDVFRHAQSVRLP